MEMSESEYYLNKYVETFDANFPYFMVRGMSEEEILKIIKESLKTGKPFEPDFDEDCLY